MRKSFHSHAAGGAHAPHLDVVAELSGTGDDFDTGVHGIHVGDGIAALLRDVATFLDAIPEIGDGSRGIPRVTHCVFVFGLFGRQHDAVRCHDVGQEFEYRDVGVAEYGVLEVGDVLVIDGTNDQCLEFLAHVIGRFEFFHAALPLFFGGVDLRGGHSGVDHRRVAWVDLGVVCGNVGRRDDEIVRGVDDFTEMAVCAAATVGVDGDRICVDFRLERAREHVVRALSCWSGRELGMREGELTRVGRCHGG